jgi:hypothetical protein
MSNVLSDEKVQQVIALGRLGWSLRQIEEATGVRRETASGYLKAAGIGVRSPGWERTAKPAIEVITDSDAAKPTTETATDPRPFKTGHKVITDFCWAKPSKPAIQKTTDTQRGKQCVSACEPYRELIEQALDRGRNAMAIWQDLVGQYGFDRGYQSVKRFVNKIRPSQTPQARPVIVTGPGEEAQVDYGNGPMVRDPQTRKYRRTRLFVMTLGCSRKSVRLLVFRSSSRTWADLHERAFRRLGGSVRIIVLDNLREGVLVPDIYDPSLNPLYRDLLAHTVL